MFVALTIATESVASERLLMSVWVFQFLALIFARCLGTTLALPAWGGSNVSKPVRVLFAFLLMLIVFPVISEECANITPLSDGKELVVFICDVVGEVLLGVAIGLTLRIIFEGVYLAGEIIARVGGISVVGSFDHNLGDEISPISRLLYWISLAVFISIGGFELFVDGYIHSFIVIPIFEQFQPEQILDLILKTIFVSCELAFKLAAPVIVSTLSVYVTVGLVGRVFPQFNLMMFAFNINALLTFLILTLVIGISCVCFKNSIIDYLEMIFYAEG